MTRSVYNFAWHDEVVALDFLDVARDALDTWYVHTRVHPVDQCEYGTHPADPDPLLPMTMAFMLAAEQSVCGRLTLEPDEHAPSYHDLGDEVWAAAGRFAAFMAQAWDTAEVRA